MTAVVRKEAMLALGEWVRPIVLNQLDEEGVKRSKTVSMHDDVEKIYVPVWFYDAWVTLVGEFPNAVPILLGRPIEKTDADEIAVKFKSNWWVTPDVA